MKYMFVFENVLSDYTSGMVMVVAEDREECDQLLWEEFGHLVERDLEGWNNPTMYSLNPLVPSGVKHVCWGGG